MRPRSGTSFSVNAPILGGGTVGTRLFNQVRGYAAVNDTEHTGHDLRAGGEQKAQRKREAQHPLAHRLLGKDLIDQQLGQTKSPGVILNSRRLARSAEGRMPGVSRAACS